MAGFPWTLLFLSLCATGTADQARSYQLPEGRLRLELMVDPRCSTGVAVAQGDSDLSMCSNLPACTDGDVFITFWANGSENAFRLPVPLAEWRNLAESVSERQDSVERLAAIIAILLRETRTSRQEASDE